MNALRQLFAEGGFVIIAIMVLSVVLYSRCFKMLLGLRRTRRGLQGDPAQLALKLPLLRLQTGEVQESFRRQRVALGAMIAAAPLLGLLGTVSGMEKTFASLAASAGEKSMEGLARGISEVLVTTESGLAVAIPAMLIVYLGHREVDRHLERLNQIERSFCAVTP